MPKQFRRTRIRGHLLSLRKYAQVDVSIDRGSLYSFSVAAVAAAGTSPFSKDVSLTGQSCSGGAGRCLQTGLTILPVPVAGERSTRRALLELGREQRDRVPSWLCFAITIALSSPASERLVSVEFADPNNTRTFSQNIRRSNFGARQVKRSVKSCFSESRKSDRKSFTCVGNGDSFDTIHCWIPAARTSADLLWQYLGHCWPDFRQQNLVCFGLAFCRAL